MVPWKNFVVILVQRKTKTQVKFGGAKSIQYPLVDSKNAIAFRIEQVAKILAQTQEQTILKTSKILFIYTLIMIS